MNKHIATAAVFLGFSILAIPVSANGRSQISNSTTQQAGAAQSTKKGESISLESKYSNYIKKINAEIKAQEKQSVSKTRTPGAFQKRGFSFDFKNNIFTKIFSGITSLLQFKAADQATEQQKEKTRTDLKMLNNSCVTEANLEAKLPQYQRSFEQINKDWSNQKDKKKLTPYEQKYLLNKVDTLFYKLSALKSSAQTVSQKITNMSALETIKAEPSNGVIDSLIHKLFKLLHQVSNFIFQKTDTPAPTPNEQYNQLKTDNGTLITNIDNLINDVNTKRNDMTNNFFNN